MSDIKYATVVPLNGANYPTWKLQCRMTLVRDGLWGYVDGSEVLGADANDQAQANFSMRKNKALATIVLTIDPTLLYLIGDEPDDPAEVWNRLQGQFQKKSWVNKLELRKRLYSLKLKTGDSVKDHLKQMVEIFNSLNVIGDAIDDEYKVVHLLASLPDEYGMLVTALQANADVPAWEIVTERLIQEDRKISERRIDSSSQVLLANSSSDKKKLTCFYCKKKGHIKKDCYKLKNDNKNNKVYKCETNESESAVMIVNHALNVAGSKKTDWIVDSGATSHMSNDLNKFVDYKYLDNSIKVSLGDNRVVNATANGTVLLNSNSLLP